MSNAVGSELLSRVVGYKIEKGDFQEVSPNLPRRIAIFAEANTANQGDLSLTPKVITSAAQAGKLYGFGSPIYQIFRILRPLFGGGLGGIPTVVLPQAEAEGATNKEVSITPVGVATGNGTHRVVISGRDNLDGEGYDIQIAEGDTAADINSKIEDAINSKLGCPCTSTSTDYDASLVTKWKGETANELQVRVDMGENDLGLSYTIDVVQAGSGTPSVSPALALVGNEWYTEYINSYGTNKIVMDAFTTFIGRPDAETPTGHFQATVMKPGVVITGTTAEDPSDISDARLDDVAIAFATAPNSEGFGFEAAANMTLLFARKCQDTPHLDVGGSYYPDMPVPADGNIGAMSEYANRDLFMKKGCTTVALVNNKYLIEDFVTTYHPVGEVPAQFRYVRDLYSIDLNVYFGYFLKEQAFVVDHVIAKDEDIVTATKVIQPKQWKAILADYFEDLVSRAIIVDSQFSIDSLTVNLDSVNPNRFNTTFKYKRSGVARISSTTATAGFNFGTLN